VSPAARRSLAAASAAALLLLAGGSAWQAWCGRPRERAALRLDWISPPPKISGAPRLPKGKQVILEAGKPARVKLLVRLKDGKEWGTPRVVKVLRKGQPAWILKGQGPPATIYLPDWGLARPALVLEATAYDPGPVDNSRGWVGTTKSGERARFGIAAVDPRVVPLGSRLYIEGYGPALAADIGGAIKGRRIDLCFNSTREAREWGRKRARVWIVDPLSPKGRRPWDALLAAPR
jgi:3D (Asp-Asp-Asp) domain-containing protein